MDLSEFYHLAVKTTNGMIIFDNWKSYKEHPILQQSFYNLKKTPATVSFILVGKVPWENT